MISPETLRRFALFAGLGPEAYKQLALMSDMVTLHDGDWLFEEGDVADALYLIVSGKVELMMNINDEGRHKSLVETVIAGEMLGWSVLVEPHIYKMGALAAETSQLIKIDGLALRGLLAANSEWGYLIMSRVANIIGDRLRNMRTRFVSMVH